MSTPSPPDAATAKNDEQPALSPLAIILIVILAINVLLGLTSLVDDIVTWRNWFSEGVLQHYHNIRNAMFGWLPFRVPDWAKDALVIYSSFVFWAARVLAAGVRIERRYKTISFWGGVAAVTFGSLQGPLVLLRSLARPKRFAERVSEIAARGGAGEAALARVRGFADAYTLILRDSNRALMWTAIIMPFAYLGILFVGSDLLSRWDEIFGF